MGSRADSDATGHHYNYFSLALRPAFMQNIGNQRRNDCSFPVPGGAWIMTAPEESKADSIAEIEPITGSPLPMESRSKKVIVGYMLLRGIIGSYRRCESLDRETYG